jgi:hypothetical protein
MAVTKEQFDALTPVPYLKARDDMRTGDILLFHSDNLGARAIEYFTDSLWCHAAFVLVLKDIDRIFLLESVDKIGVHMMPLSLKLNGMPARPNPYPGKLLLARYKDFPSEDSAKVGEMTKVALDRLGYPYSMEELARIAHRIALRMIGRFIPGSLEESDRFICSEYVAMCYDAMGIKLQPDKDGFMAPGDIANDPNIYAVHALTHD